MESTNYKESSSQTNTKTKMYGVTTTKNTKVTFKASVQTSAGKKVNTGNVVFKVNGKSIGSSKVSNGIAKTTFTIPDGWNDIKYTLLASYKGNSQYKASSGTNTLKLKNTLDTTIKVTDLKAKNNQKVTFKAILTTSDGKYVKEGKVAFKINGKSIGVSSVSNGGAKLSYTIPDNWSDSKYTINAVFGKNEYYKECKGQGTFTLIPKTDTNIKIVTTSVTAGKKVKFVATLTSPKGKNINSGNAVFKINGKSIRKVSVTEGKATLSFTIPKNWAGNYKISLVYSGNKQFKSAKKTSTLTVKNNLVPKGYERYVKKTKNCDVTNSKIKSLTSKLTRGIGSTYKKAVKIFNYVRDKVSYSSYYDTRYGSVGTLNRKYGNCVDQSHLLIALFRASSLPARYCHATCHFRSGLVTGHVWAEVYVNNKWYKADTTSSRNSFGIIRNWYKSSAVRRYTELYF